MSKTSIILSTILLIISSCTYTTIVDDDKMLVDKNSLDIDIKIGTIDFNNMLIDCQNDEIEESITLQFGENSYSGTIKIHGGASRTYPKKSFQINLQDKIPARYLFSKTTRYSQEHLVDNVLVQREP